MIRKFWNKFIDKNEFIRLKITLILIGLIVVLLILERR